MEIPSGVYDVLTDPRTVITDDRVQVPFQLDRPRYEQVDKVLKEIGGRWDGRRTVRAHVFPFPVEEYMRACLATREFPSRNEQGWYPTPSMVVDEMLAHAGVGAGMSVLEPSAGTGSIVGPAAESGGVVDCVEIDERRVRALNALGAARRARRFPRPGPARLPPRLRPGPDEPAVLGSGPARDACAGLPR